MSHKLTVVIIEDEKNICTFIETTLANHDYKAVSAYTGKEGISCIASLCPDVVLLDLGLPDIDGIDVIRSVREFSSVPILVISARSEENEKVAALDAGADDYLVKPFGVMEMVSRVKAVLRRCRPQETGHVLSAGGISLDPERRTVTVEGQRVQLTYKEFELLTYFLENQGIALSREKILNSVWNYDYFGDARTIDTHVKKLRSKLGDKGEYIKTIWGMGYKFEV